MSLLAGFDLVAEISRGALLRLLQKHLKIAGQPMRPPFELYVPVAAPAATGEAHLIVSGVDLVLNPDDSVTLAFSFERSSVEVSTPASVVLSKLAGQIRITAPLRVHSPNWWTRALAIDLSGAIVGVTSPKLSGTPFQAPAEAAVEGFVRAIGLVEFPLAFPVVGRSLADGKPVGDGSLEPLRMVSLETHRIDGETLGLFCTLLAANDGAGDHTRKTARALTGGRDIALSLSPQAFHTLVFCPQMAKALGVAVAGLPGSCGSSSGVAKGGATITGLTDRFAHDHIDIDLSVNKSGPCYNADASLSAAIVLATKAGALVPTVTAGTPRIEVRVRGWLCQVALAVVGGPLGFVGIELAESFAERLAGVLVNEALKKGVAPIGFGQFGAAFDAVSVSPEGLTLQGTLPIVLPSPKARGLELVGSVATRSSTEVSRGTYKAKGTCPTGSFPYTESLQQQTGTYRAVGTLLGRPLTLNWWLQALPRTAPVPLTGSSGTVSLFVSRHYPFPLPWGAALDGSVEVGYTLKGDTVTLTNVPEQGVYSFSLHARATEDGAELDAQESPLFEGHTVVIEGYRDARLKCEIDNLPHAPLEWHPPVSDPAGWGSWLSDHPVPWELIGVIHALVVSGDPDADETLSGLKLAHGSSFYRALLSPQTTRVALPSGDLSGELVLGGLSGELDA